MCVGASASPSLKHFNSSHKYLQLLKTVQMHGTALLLAPKGKARKKPGKKRRAGVHVIDWRDLELNFDLLHVILKWDGLKVPSFHLIAASAMKCDLKSNGKIFGGVDDSAIAFGKLVKRMVQHTRKLARESDGSYSLRVSILKDLCQINRKRTEPESQAETPDDSVHRPAKRTRRRGSWNEPSMHIL